MWLGIGSSALVCAFAFVLLLLVSVVAGRANASWAGSLLRYGEALIELAFIALALTHSLSSASAKRSRLLKRVAAAAALLTVFHVLVPGYALLVTVLTIVGGLGLVVARRPGTLSERLRPTGRADERADDSPASATASSPAPGPPSAAGEHEMPVPTLMRTVAPGQVDHALLERIWAERIEVVPGMDSVKRQFRGLLERIENDLARSARVTTLVPNLSFSGAPGTGKTTSARWAADILYALGVLPGNHLVEVGARDMLGSYIGHTAPKTTELFERARGGVLLIDEIGYLAKESGTSGQDFAGDVISVMLKKLEDERGVRCVIVAGYESDLAKFLAMDAGLARRIDRAIHFPDFSPDECVAAARYQAAHLPEFQLELAEASLLSLHAFVCIYGSDPKVAWSNAGSLRQILSIAADKLAARMSKLPSPSLSERNRITDEDMLAALEQWLRQHRHRERRSQSRPFR